MLVITSQIAIPDDELTFTFARSGGPGGQNVNKVSSKATLRWSPASSPSLPDDVRARLLARCQSRLTNEGELVITSQEFRDQGKNIAACREKLRLLVLASVTPPKKRRPTKPTRGSKERRLNEKRKSGERKSLRRSPRGE